MGNASFRIIYGVDSLPSQLDLCPESKRLVRRDNVMHRTLLSDVPRLSSFAPSESWRAALPISDVTCTG